MNQQDNNQTATEAMNRASEHAEMVTRALTNRAAENRRKAIDALIEAVVKQITPARVESILPGGMSHDLGYDLRDQVADQVLRTINGPRYADALYRHVNALIKRVDEHIVPSDWVPPQVKARQEADSAQPDLLRQFGQACRPAEQPDSTSPQPIPNAAPLRSVTIDLDRITDLPESVQLRAVELIGLMTKHVIARG